MALVAGSNGRSLRRRSGRKVALDNSTLTATVIARTTTLLDGTDNNDPFFNNSALNQTGIGGAPASLLPIDAIQEFNLQSQFRAEYGRNSGSVINIITRSGTNQFHGSALSNFFVMICLMRAIISTAWLIHPAMPTRKLRSATISSELPLGGPIVKDKTFFFGAYEGQREQVGSDFSLLVPTQTQISEAQQSWQGIGDAGKSCAHQHSDEVFSGQHKWTVSWRCARQQQRG